MRMASSLFGFVVLAASSALAQAPSEFTTQIRPILERACWNCHGESLQLSGLDLSTRASALRGGDSGAAIVPGRAEESRFYRRVAGLEAPKMPLEGDPLTPEEIAAVRAWIEAGVHWEDGGTTAASNSLAIEGSELSGDRLAEAREYWAFRPPEQAPLAAIPGLENPIDRFLEKSRRDSGLRAAPRADARTLVRRAYLDLLGLPPSPEETEAFLADSEPGAWPRLIERLLASPHYGERWGRHWLDVARYADSSGFEHDRDRPNAWRYRDYVIEAFNEDKPYDRFLVEQIAGDEMDDRSDETRIATGFLRAGPRVLFREKDNPERRHDYLDDVLATDRPRNPRPHRPLRALPRSQIRSDPAERLLPPAGVDLRLRRNGVSAFVRGRGRSVQEEERGDRREAERDQRRGRQDRGSLSRAPSNGAGERAVSRERAARGDEAGERKDRRGKAPRGAGPVGWRASGKGGRSADARGRRAAEDSL